jgi:oxygen-dependent protoporphyrinogen oxidase
MESERVAVVGAGLAGLAAAWRLAQAGKRVVVYEAARVGGRMQSDEIQGAVADTAVQLLSSTYSRTLVLASEVGRGGDVVRAPGKDAMWRDGEAHGISYGSMASMLTSGALPAGLKLRLATKYVPFLKREAASLSANDPSGTGGAELDGESIAEWGRRELGEDFVELMAYPLLAAYYGGVAEEMSAAMYHALARVGLDVKVMAMREGMGALPRGVASALVTRGAEVREGQRVSAVRRAASGVEVDAGGTEHYAAAVVATPAPVARSLLAATGPLDAWLDGVRMSGTLTVAFLLSGRPRVNWFGLSFPRSTLEGRELVALCAPHSKHSKLVPPGMGLLLAFPAPPVARRLIEAPSEEIVARLLPVIDRVLPGTEKRVLVTRVYRFAEGYTLFRPGYLQHLSGFDAAWLPLDVSLAGDYMVAPTVEGAVLSGERAARRLLSRRPA